MKTLQLIAWNGNCVSLFLHDKFSSFSYYTYVCLSIENIDFLDILFACIFLFNPTFLKYLNLALRVTNLNFQRFYDKFRDNSCGRFAILPAHE